jgi:hypothetical protein
MRAKSETIGDAWDLSVARSQPGSWSPIFAGPSSAAFLANARRNI